MIKPIYLQAMVNVQMLSELEEVIQYKLVPERREAIKQMWWDRLQVSDIWKCPVPKDFFIKFES